MIFRFIGATAFTLLLFAFGFSLLLNKNQPSQSATQSVEKNSLREIARRTKAEGRLKIRVPGPISDYPGEDMGFDEAVQEYTLAVAEPLTNKSYVVDSNGVRTWYKFRIIELLSRRNSVLCYTCPPVPDAPREMFPISADEFLIATGGGTVAVDGVDITVDNSALPMFETGKRYLLFISLTPTGVALLGAGPAGVFRVGVDERLEPVSREDRPIQAQVHQRFAFRLSKLKERVMQ